jgi:WxL domain surface cell wall-binding
MFSLKSRFTRLSAGLVLTTAFTLGAALPAFASDTVSQTLNGGSRTASVANLTLAAVTYSHSAQAQTGTMTLTADDSTATGAGWNVTIQSSAFVWAQGGSAALNGTNIPAANFALTSAAQPAMTAGQAYDMTGGPNASVTSGTLDSARKVIQANALFGQGTYTQDLGVTLTIPAQSHAGTYTGTLTTSITAAP